MPADETLPGSTDRPRTRGDPTDVPPALAGLDESDRHRVLASARRRHVLSVLSGRTPPVPLAALAAAVVAREPDADPAADAARRDAAISLHHVHLPLLADFGLVEYDAGENVVRG